MGYVMSVSLPWQQKTPKLEGNYLFTGVVSVTLNFHPQGRNVNDVTNEGEVERSEAGRPL